MANLSRRHLGHNTRRDRDGGFTLLEVLVALAILAITLGVLLPVFSNVIRTQSRSQDERTAIALAQSKLAAVGTTLDLVDGITEGTFDNGFGWRLEITAYAPAMPDAQIPIKLATLTVNWPKPSGGRSLTLKAIRPAPKR